MESTSLPTNVKNSNRHVINKRKQDEKNFEIHVKFKENITAWVELENLRLYLKLFRSLFPVYPVLHSALYLLFLFEFVCSSGCGV